MAEGKRGKRSGRRGRQGNSKHQAPSVDAESQLKRWAILEERRSRGANKNPKKAIKKILKRSAVKKQGVTMEQATEQVVGLSDLATATSAGSTDEASSTATMPTVKKGDTSTQGDRGQRVKDRARELRAQLLVGTAGAMRPLH